MSDCAPTVTLDDLISAALTEQPYNQQRLGREAERYARKLSNLFARDLPEDIRGEIFTQAFAELFTAGPDALQNKSGITLFRAAVFSAIRAVRASYTPPGQRTRSGPAPSYKVAAEHIESIPDRHMIERCTVGEGVDRALNFDLLQDPASATPHQQIENHLDARTILDRAPVTLREALRLIYLDDEPVELTAKRLDLSRFALKRRLDAFCADWRAAA